MDARLGCRYTHDVATAQSSFLWKLSHPLRVLVCTPHILNAFLKIYLIEKKMKQQIQLPMVVPSQFYPIKFLKPYKFIRDFISFLFCELQSKYIL
jgi:hypothetical protein